MNKLLIRLVNSFYPGYSGCSRCGRNWGWTKHKSHLTSTHGGLFLFCVDCDKKVTPEERWEALDKWKSLCIRQLRLIPNPNALNVQKEEEYIDNTEFTEFPRREDVISGI